LGKSTEAGILVFFGPSTSVKVRFVGPKICASLMWLEFLANAPLQATAWDGTAALE
jgi:hypothetical protein